MFRTHDPGEPERAASPHVSRETWSATPGEQGRLRLWDFPEFREHLLYRRFGTWGPPGSAGGSPPCALVIYRRTADRTPQGRLYATGCPSRRFCFQCDWPSFYSCLRSRLIQRLLPWCPSSMQLSLAPPTFSFTAGDGHAESVAGHDAVACMPR